jgi:hypothetical protein
MHRAPADFRRISPISGIFEAHHFYSAIIGENIPDTYQRFDGSSLRSSLRKCSLDKVSKSAMLWGGVKNAAVGDRLQSAETLLF